MNALRMAFWILVIWNAQIAGRTEQGDDMKNSSFPEKKVLVSNLGNAGWHPLEKKDLEIEIHHLISSVPDSKALLPIKALIMPHAGFRFSGATAAYGIKVVQKQKYERIVILGPSHTHSLVDQATVSQHTHYATPLGEIAVDTDFASKLLRHSCFVSLPEAHEKEHSIQIEIPFTQYAFPLSKIVPVIIGQTGPKAAKEMAKILTSLMDESTLLIISSDFMHYGNRFGYLPFTSEIKQNIEKMDMNAFERVSKKDPEGFYNYCYETGITICGRNPILVLLHMLTPDDQVHLLHYDTSGSLTGDWKNCVSYVSAAITGSWNRKSAAIRQEVLTGEEKKNLLKLARLTIDYYLKTGKALSLQEAGMVPTEGMTKIMGAFVTLKNKGHLRGCIGEIFPRRALYEAVISHAINSSSNDHRFNPVSVSELKELEIEISALTPPTPVNSFNEIQIGKHGIVLQKNGRSAVFLPQVATEQKWNLEETLSHLSRKAGLSFDGWKKDASFLVFEAVVFSEHS